VADVGRADYAGKFQVRAKEVAMLDDTETRRFIEDGFVRIDGGFPREIADAG
jgi:hypothetical protein